MSEIGDIRDLEARLAKRDARLSRLSDGLLRGPSGAAYAWFVWAWALAVAARLTLLQVTQPGWGVPSACLIAGALGLVVWGGRVWWLLSLIGLLVPLLFLGDWLTQTVIMSLIAGVGLVWGGRSELGDRGRPAVCAAAHWLTAATYLVAAFHKLNADFFDPTVSCATYTWHELDAAFSVLTLNAPPGILASLPWIAVAIELSLAVLLFARRRWAYVLGLGFHLPLTIVLAPAFVFVMLVGYVGALGERDRAALVTIARSDRLSWVLAVAAGLALWMLCDAGWLLGPKIVGLCILLMAAIRLLRASPGGAPAAMSPGRQATAAGAVAVFLALGMTPYTGRNVQHSGAMLSNLRLDSGCWNHLIVPESVRTIDPYVRVSHASIGDDGAFPRREAVLTTQLWSPRALRTIRQNWCRESTRPIALVGTYRGAPFQWPDLCADESPLPPSLGVLGGEAWFDGLLRFRKGLTRGCPQQCIH